MNRWTLALAAAIAIGGSSLHAHHSISSVYDGSRQLTIEGTVAQFQLVNPHPFLLIDVKAGGTGDAQRWQLEMDNRSELATIGVTASTFKPGDRVVVRGSLARTQGQRMYLLRLDRAADGFWYEQVGQSPRIRPPTNEDSHIGLLVARGSDVSSLLYVDLRSPASFPTHSDS
jgi:hypothetical protein